MKKVILAPMSGFTHSAFRRLARRLGADWTWSELISARMVLSKGLDDPLLHFTPEERPINLQLYGSDPDDLFRAGELILKYLRPDGLDLNAGCPAPKVVKTYAGAALLKDLHRLYEAACAICAVCNQYGCKASVKFRLGFSEDCLEDLVEVLTQAGIKILILHARLAKEGFSVKARWSRIRDLKRLVGNQALVIGNGDVKSFKDIEGLFQATNCDGVMIGRAALARPWIFKEWKHSQSIELNLAERISLLEQLWTDLKRGKKKAANAFKSIRLLIPKIFKGLKACRRIVHWLLKARDEETLWQRLHWLKINQYIGPRDVVLVDGGSFKMRLISSSAEDPKIALTTSLARTPPRAGS